MKICFGNVLTSTQKYSSFPYSKNTTIIHPQKNEHQTCRLNRNNFFISAACALPLLGIGVVSYVKYRKNSVKVFDIEYKKELLKFLNIPQITTKSLTSVAGKDEFLSFLAENQTNKKIFSVGKNFINIKNKEFGANLHIHTLNSDGQMSVRKLLNISAEYADKYYQKTRKPFFIAITDHNTFNGNKEALNILVNEPEKYKNLRVVLGAEIDAIENGNRIHTLMYGVNPYKNGMVRLLNTQQSQYKSNICSVLKKANEMYSNITDKYNFQFTLADMSKIRPSVLHSPANVNYSLKDYMQFRILYADLIENNNKLNQFLKAGNIDVKKLDFSVPKFSITQTLPKEPYYLNYLDELYKYLETDYKNTTGSQDVIELRKYYKKISPDIQKVLDELEYNTIGKNEPLYCPSVKYESLDKILDIYAQGAEQVCGLAHPCLIYGYNGVHKDTVKNRELMETVFKKFGKKIKSNKISESYYNAYFENFVSQDWRDYAKNLADKNNFLHSGSYDSHNNTPFTNQEFLSKQKVQELLK